MVYSKRIISSLLFIGFLSFSSICFGIPNGYQSYLERPDIAKLTPKSGAHLPKIWEQVKSALPATTAQLLEMYPEHDIYYLA